jgi:hypothetical protein
MKKHGIYLFIGFLMAVVPVLADPPMKVVYSNTQTTHFKWTWPFQTLRTYTAVQTKPYYPTGRIIYMTQEDISKYRFYFPQRVCRNEWGYYFPPGTRLCSHMPAVIFGAPPFYIETIQQKY